jgi:hypothetical protein
MSDLKKLVVILGLGRSGTSTFARALRIFGVDLGDNLTPPEIGVNDKGFFEDEDFLAINREMLTHLGVDWFYASDIPIPQSKVDALIEKGFLERAAQLLSAKMSGKALYAFKDGRTTKLIPFWNAVFEKCNLDQPRYLIVVRNPISAAKSYRKYSKIDEKLTYMLWTGYTLAALKGSNQRKRVLSDYDRLLENPRREIARIGHHLDFEVNQDEAEDFENNFLDPSLQHTIYTEDDVAENDEIPEITKKLYRAILKVSSDEMRLDSEEFQISLEKWIDEYAKFSATFGFIDDLCLRCKKMQVELAYMAEIQDECGRLKDSETKLQAELVLLERVNAQAQQVISVQDRKIREIMGSRSMRLTSVMRSGANLLRKLRKSISF